MAKKGKLSASALGKTVEDYVGKLPAEQQKIVRTLLALVRSAAPDASLSIKWAQPVFERNGPFCYVRAFKNHVNVGFWRGVEIDAGQGVLPSGGQKMAHVKITSEMDIPSTLIRQWVKAAVRLNKAEGDPTKT